MYSEAFPYNVADDLKLLISLKEFVLFDSEYTAWAGSLAHKWSRPGEVREMFQWGLLRVKKGESGLFEETLSEAVYIKTVMVPILPQYSVELTGVTQQDIDSQGIPFERALKKMYTISEEGKLPILSYGSDRDVLVENCSLLNVVPPKFQSGFCNIRSLLVSHDARCGSLSSGQLHTLVPQGKLVGHTHNALHDVKSILVYMNYLSKSSADSNLSSRTTF